MSYGSAPGSRNANTTFVYEAAFHGPHNLVWQGLGGFPASFSEATPEGRVPLIS